MTVDDEFDLRDDRHYRFVCFLNQREKNLKPKSSVKKNSIFQTFVEEVKCLCTEKDRLGKPKNSLKKHFGRATLPKIPKQR